jgi:hypothetical protein
VAGLALKGGDQFLIRLVEGDRRIRTKIGQCLQDLFISRGRLRASRRDAGVTS